MKGFSLIETIILLAALFLLAALGFGSTIIFRSHSRIDSGANKVLSAMQMAREKSLAMDPSASFGLYFSTSSQETILFRGIDYDRRNPIEDFHYDLRDLEIFPDFNGNRQIVFSSPFGTASPSGEVLLRSGSLEKRIYVATSGEISFQPIVAVSDSERIKDSRHTHFDLGWSMQNATHLKFNFPTASSLNIVDILAAFNQDKSVFSWEGSFIVGGTEQHFKVHTHTLSSTQYPYTRLCLHRDRNQKNDKDVTIYITDGGVDKEVAIYQASSVLIGTYGGIFSPQ